MELETILVILCAVYIIPYILINEINRQWEGFDRFKKKGHK